MFFQSNTPSMTKTAISLLYGLGFWFMTLILVIWKHIISFGKNIRDEAIYSKDTVH